MQWKYSDEIKLTEQKQKFLISHHMEITHCKACRIVALCVSLLG